jgi:hypothetical protein
MADYPESRQLIQTEETRYRSSVSEWFLQKLAATHNFISKRQHDKRDLFANGRYNIMSSYPQLGVDGLIIFEYDVEIINLYIWNGIAGSSGTTEIDIKWKPQSSGAYQTMFSTTPKITSTAANYSICGVGDTITGFTAPVLLKTEFDAKDVLRMDILGCMSGNVEGCGIIIHYRPR